MLTQRPISLMHYIDSSADFALVALPITITPTTQYGCNIAILSPKWFNSMSQCGI